ncbi:unnamed protein product [Boreogadus saida]
MHQKGSLISPLLNGVFCQCDSSESHRGAKPGGVDRHAEEHDCTSPTNHLPPGQSFVSADDTEKIHSLLPHPCELCGGPEQDHRLKVLFQILDVNGDGGICVNDLSIGLKKLGVHRTEHELMGDPLLVERHVLRLDVTHAAPRGEAEERARLKDAELADR